MSHRTWSIFCALQDSPGPQEWTPKETLLARVMYPELLPCAMHGQRAACNQPLKFKQLSWHVAGSSKAQTCNQMTHATQSQPPSLLLCICSGAAVWQSCPPIRIKCGRELQTLLEPRMLLCTIMHCAFCPITVQFCTVAHCCMQWAWTANTACCGVGESCLVCSSWDLCPGHSYHICPGTQAQWMHSPKLVLWQ